ncbi:MAG: ATP-grasp domain-containing protein [Candidatus Eremiobacterota bacterium]
MSTSGRRRGRRRRLCHEFPGSYPYLEGHTPRSVWSVGREWSMDLLRGLTPPLVLKDYVKSRKHEWAEACYIPELSQAERVVDRFLELQGEDFQGGLVFREFVDLPEAARHPRSGTPLPWEVRLFFFQGRRAWLGPYWGDLTSTGPWPPEEPFLNVASRIPSPFFSMDLALGRDGRWWIMEVGDGQVSGLPRDSDAPGFYRALRELTSE